MAGYTLVTPPSGEPLTLAEAKLHLKVDTTADDTLITALITAARQFAEQKTRRSLLTQVWRYTADAFPNGFGIASPTPWGREFSIPDAAICLEKGPVSAINSITYLDMAGLTQTMASTDYTADLSGPLARITPVFGKIWPIPMPQIGSVAVNFTAGYGTASDVPSGLKQWMLMRIGAMYENREEIVVGQRLTSVDLPFVDSLLEPYAIVSA